MEFGGEVGQAAVGVDVGAAGDDPERQEEPAAPGEEFGHGLGFGRRPCSARALGEQGSGVLVAERVQGQVTGAVADDQPGEGVAAGYHDGAGVSAREHRGDLVGVGGVVQDDQHPFAGDQAAEQRRLRLWIGGDAAGVDAEGVEEPAHGHRWRQWLAPCEPPPARHWRSRRT